MIISMDDALLIIIIIIINLLPSFTKNHRITASIRKVPTLKFFLLVPFLMLY